MTLDGLTICGVPADERVFEAAVKTMRFCRSCSSSASDLLFSSELKAGAMLAAPLPRGLILTATTETAATRTTATQIAGKTTPVRRNRPFFFRALRGLLSGPVFRDPPLKDGPFRPFREADDDR
jgi:hypothetical protein